MEWIEGCPEATRTADQNTGLMGKLKRKSISLMKQKKEAESTLMQIYQDYRDGMLDMQSFMDLREQLSNEKANAEKEITDILSMQRQTKIRVKKVREFLTTIDGLVFYSWNEELLRRIVEKVELKPDGTVKVALMMKDEIEKLTMED
jgi:phage-related tail protein